MQIHVRAHTSGLKCKKCGKSYPNVRSLKEYLKLHEKHVAFQCTSCDKSFTTEHSLHIHVKGNHRSGYECKCGEVFKPPIQCARHTKKCLST